MSYQTTAVFIIKDNTEIHATLYDGKSINVDYELGGE